eukprot:comp23957_c0_seq1/m.42413 comp23957_c0_seq1/g.42413  ORF comp23957_c0_seq1/g.42413 comp23957_c0_seq1/m.42413 type:complete len:685 (-) comp23957_c0_seq1:122-2176(-)
MSEKLTFNDICHSTPLHPANNHGTLKVAQTGMAWRHNQDKENIFTIMKDNLASAQWRKAANGYELKCLCRDNNYYRLDGFEEQDLGTLQRFFKKNYDVDIGVVEQAIKGFNWGDLEVKGNFVSFLVDGKVAFDVPISEVTQSSLSSNKMEVAVEFQQPHDKPGKHEMLYEMRFFFTKDQEKEAAGEEDEEGGAAAVETRAQRFQKRLSERTDKSRFSGDSVATFPEFLFLTPRGKYQLEFFPKFVKLHGPTHNYNVMYQQVQRIFLLPKPDGFFYAMALQLDPPVRQGQTMYPFLIVQIPKDEEIDLEYNMTPEQREGKFEGRLTDDMVKGLTIQALPKLLKALTGRKVVLPGDFKAVDESKCVKCAYKTSHGFLYPLDSGLLFIHKPAIYVRYQEIILATFDRQAGSGMRSFELIVSTKNNKYSFANIRREEYPGLIDKFNAKDVKCEETEPQGSYNFSMQAGNDHDGYLNRVQAEGDDDESEDDEDFKPVSESDVEEEYDSEAGGDSSGSEKEGGDDAEEGDGEEKKEKKRKAPKEKKEKPAKKQKTEKPEKDSKRKQKKQKDENAPKKPVTPYMMFCKEQRETLKAQHPTLSQTELMKAMGEEWKKRGDDEKKKYKERYDAEMEEYKVLAKDYEASKPKEESEPKDQKKKQASKSSKSPAKKKVESQYQSAEFIEDSDVSD